MTVQAKQSKNAGFGGDSASVPLVPRINIQAFCDLPQTAEVVRAAFADRRMARAHGTVVTGGIPAAVRLYQTQSTPNLLIVESDAPRDVLLAGLASLAEVCQPDTKVVVLGHANDVMLYRELMRQGVSEYAVAPFAPLQLVDAIAALYRTETASPVGRVIAFVGAKGGRVRARSHTIAPGTTREQPMLKRRLLIWISPTARRLSISTSTRPAASWKPSRSRNASTPCFSTGFS